MTPKDVARKVRGLLAVAADPGATGPERAAAGRLAASWASRYGLDAENGAQRGTQPPGWAPKAPIASFAFTVEVGP